jgi:perosamine synthetase
VRRFEAEFASYCGVRHAIATCNGTSALHLALLSLGVGPGDEVIVPTLTYVATVNAISYCNAVPVFVDCEESTRNLDPCLIERRITPRTKGIIAVHLYGQAARMDPIGKIARSHGLFVLEDGAEAHGSEYQGRRVGALGDACAFSFYGNKIITTGEGGMVTTNDDDVDRSARLLQNQGMRADRRYWFPVVGYNYRMTNIQAAIGVAQLENIDWNLKRRRLVAAWYEKHLSGLKDFIELPQEMPWGKKAFWICNVFLKDGGTERDEVMRRLEEAGVETRPVFYPVHLMPPYREPEGSYPVAERIGARGISLPTHCSLKEEDVAYIADQLAMALEGASVARSSGRG